MFWSIYSSTTDGSVFTTANERHSSTFKSKNRLRFQTCNFLIFPAGFSIPIFFSNLNSNCSDLLDMRNLQEQVKKAFCYQKMFWPFTVWINCSSDLKKFANSLTSTSKFFSNTRTFFLSVGQNSFVNKIPFLCLI